MDGFSQMIKTIKRLKKANAQLVAELDAARKELEALRDALANQLGHDDQEQ